MSKPKQITREEAEQLWRKYAGTDYAGVFKNGYNEAISDMEAHKANKKTVNRDKMKRVDMVELSKKVARLQSELVIIKGFLKL